MASLPIAHALRRIPLGGIACVTAVGGMAATIRTVAGGDAAALLPWLRLTVLMLAAASAGCISDPPEIVTQTTPFGRARRRLLAAVLTFVLAATGLFVIGAIALAVDATASVPLSGLLIELAALCGVGWLLCAAIVFVDGPHRAPARAAAALVTLAAVTFVSPWLMHALWVGPGPEWRTSHLRWVAIGAVACFGCTRLSRDPLARSRWVSR